LARRIWSLYSIAAVALFVFLGLGRMVMANQTLAFDTAVRNTIHGWASSPLTWLMTGITQIGAPAVLIVVTLVAGWLFAAQGQTRLAAVLAISTIGAAAVDESLKVVYHRIRPVAFFGYDEPMTYSFPSGHAATSVCFYGLLAMIVTARTKSAARRRAFWAATALLVLLIGFSRVYLGVHYPTDVLGGYAFGLVWILAVVPSTAGRWLRHP
jgi:membrane-associated phospholipid phosphatase